ncbi:MAG: serine protein kinase RIO [Candidatus Altiarchaeota archaeon]|nr:serine protein kinase RIO [Candidatus Altiarchaeota archaeon]
MDRKILDKVFDKPTLFNIHALFNKGIFREFGGPIADGKEARVFSAYNDTKLAVKVYRVDASSFETLHKYIKGDPRFWHVGKSRRNIVNLWVRKEFSNLKRLYAAGVSVPKPYAFKGNTLVMTFIGDKIPSPQLREVELKNPEELFYNIIEDVKKLYEIGKLVHADLSEYNILIKDDKHIIIDVGQAVDIRHPKAREFMLRDIKNICDFFSKYITVKEKDIREYILGKDKEDVK